MGDLPWHVENPWHAEAEVYMQSVSNAYATKQALVNYALPITIPLEIAHILDSAAQRELNGLYLSTLARLRSQCRDLAYSLGERDIDRDSLNWSPVLPPASLPPPGVRSDSGYASGFNVFGQSNHPPDALGCTYNDREPVNEYFTDSYYETLYETWSIAYGRRLSLTLPPDVAEFLDGQLPDIADIKAFLPPMKT